MQGRQPTFSPGPGEGSAGTNALWLQHHWLTLPRLCGQLTGFAAALQRCDVLGQPFVEPCTRPLPNLLETETQDLKPRFLQEESRGRSEKPPHQVWPSQFLHTTLTPLKHMEGQDFQLRIQWFPCTLQLPQISNSSPHLFSPVLPWSFFQH